MSLHIFVSSAYANVASFIILPAKEIIILYPWDIWIPIPKRYHSFLHIAWTDHSLYANIILYNKYKNDIYKSDRFSHDNYISFIIFITSLSMLYIAALRKCMLNACIINLINVICTEFNFNNDCNIYFATWRFYFLCVQYKVSVKINKIKYETPTCTQISLKQYSDQQHEHYHTSALWHHATEAFP